MFSEDLRKVSDDVTEDSNMSDSSYDPADESE